MKRGLFLLGFAAFSLCGCHVNTIYDRVDVDANKTALNASPKRASIGYDLVHIWNDTAETYYLNGNTNEGQAVQGGNTGTIIPSNQANTDLFRLFSSNAGTYVNFALYGSNEQAATIRDITDWTLIDNSTYFYSWYPFRSTGYPFQNVKVTTEFDLGTISITNEKADGEGPITIYNEHLESVLRVEEGETGSLNRNLIPDHTLQLQTDSVYCNIGTTSMGDDVAANVLSYAINLNTPTTLYVSSNEPYYTIENQTPWSVTYYLAAIFDINENTRSYNAREYAETISYATGQPITLICNYPFEVRENSETPQQAAYLQNVSGNMWSGLEGYYGITFPSTSTTEGTTLTISASSGEGESVLWGTFSTIAKAFTSLTPILSTPLFGDITLGIILLIPFTFALIVLIFKLIKK